MNNPTDMREWLDGLPRMTRKQAVAFLRGRGYPVTINTLNLACGQGRGPQPACKWGARIYLYEPRELLIWAEGQLRSVA
jgi:hypothetical protein